MSAHEFSVQIEVDDSGEVRWLEGTLLYPDPSEACACIARFQKGLEPGTLVSVIGRYERPSRHVRRLHVAHIRRGRTPLQRGEEALRLWDRKLGSGASDEAVSAARAELDRWLVATADNTSPEARGLRARVEAKSHPSPDPAFASLLHSKPPVSSETLSQVYRAERDRGLDPAPTEADREALVEQVWQPQPYTDGLRPDLAPYWDFWVHPLVREVQQSLTQRANFPWHFGGPRVEPDLEALWPWIDARFISLATPEERAAIDGARKLSAAEKKKWLQRLHRQDERRYDRAYKSMADRWQGGPDGLDSPPDDVAVTWDELGGSLPARWCGYALAFAGEADSHRTPSPNHVGGTLTELHRKRLPEKRGAFALALDAAVIASTLDREVTRGVESVLFVSSARTCGRALLQLDDGGLALLEATAGPFGDWTLHREMEARLLSRLPEAECALAAMAIQKGAAAWPVVSPASHSIVRRPGQTAEAPRWVRHSRYGRGLVVGSTPGPRGAKLTIEFEGHGQKQLLHTFVEEI